MAEKAAERRRDRVTYEEVVEACEGLVRQGAKPSVRLVMAAVGGGSPNTINEHLKNWRKMQHAAASVRDGEGLLSEAFRAALAHEIERIKEEGRNETRARLEELDELHGLEQERAEQYQARCILLEQELAALRVDYQASVSKFEQQLFSSHAEMAAAAKDLAEHEAHRHTHRAETQKAQLAAAEAISKLNISREQVEALQQENVALRSDLQTARSEAIQSQKQAAVAEALSESRGGQIANFKEDMAQVRSESRETQERAAAEQRRAEIAEARIEALQDQLQREETRTGGSRGGLLRQRARLVTRAREPQQ